MFLHSRSTVYPGEAGTEPEMLRQPEACQHLHRCDLDGFSWSIASYHLLSSLYAR